MRIRLVFIFLSLLFVSSLWGDDTIPVIPVSIPDSLIVLTGQVALAQENNAAADTLTLPDKRKRDEPITLDSLAFRRNPLFGELVYMGKSIDIPREKPDFHRLYFGVEPHSLSEPMDMFEAEHPAGILKELRNNAKNYITTHDFSLYKTTVEELPEFTVIRRGFEDHYNSFFLEVNKPDLEGISSRSLIKESKPRYWRARLKSSVQFSENYVSKNWHKGGYNNLALLGILEGALNYDNFKKIKWENTLEWRNGINTVDDTLRNIVPNDDLFRVTSKFGLKATGNFYYSTKAELQTQFFNTPKAINSYELKARFLTPVIFNMGIGMDFKYKELSVALSPLSYQYIYLSDTTATSIGEYIDPNTFGIEHGQNKSEKWGSELTVILKNYSPVTGLILNSNFKFFTNYKSVIIDWEIVAEFRINRFLSTRLLLNPRYDDSVILPEGEKHRIQFKQMLTIGLSFRFY